MWIIVLEGLINSIKLKNQITAIIIFMSLKKGALWIGPTQK